jgi:hypothetical protein
MENLRNTEICYPEVTTYFIAWSDNRSEIKSYGIIETFQCMDTIWNEVDFYIDEFEWVSILMQNGINPFEKN